MKRLLLLYLYLLPYILIAQEPVVFQFTEKDGLPDIEFYNGIEDSKGFVWLAADKGFYRFDGKEFKNYSNEEKRGLSVFEPFEDKLGRVWCVNISGQLFYVENDKLITFIDLGNQFNGELVKYIVRDYDVLVFSRTKILSVNLKSKEITLIKSSLNSVGSPFQFGKIITICIDDEVYQLVNNQLEKEEVLKPNIKFSNVDSESVFFQFQKNLFLLRKSLDKNKEQVLYLKKSNFQEIAIPIELKNKRLNSFFEKDNLIWFCTNDGVYAYDFKEQKFELKKTILKGVFITKMIVDNSQNYWFTSLKSGIYVIPNVNISQLEFSFEHGGISCIDKINADAFVFGTTNGKAGIYNSNNKTLTEIKLATKSKVSAIAYNSFNDEILISQEDNSGIYKNSKYTITNNFINAKKLTFINENTFVYATFNGAYILNTESNKPLLLGNNSSYKRTYTSHYNAISKETYVGYVDNLIVYDKSFNSKQIKNYGKSIFALSLTETDDGIVWVSTFKDGIFGIVNSQVKYKFNESNGLISNQTRIIKADGNNLWIATDKGIQLFDSNTKTFKTLTKPDGISSYNITGIAVFDKEVVFASNMGLMFLKKENVFKQTKTPSIYFTEVQVNEKTVNLTPNYEWNYNQNSVKIKFNTNGFRSNEKHQYKHRLIGLDNVWITLDKGIDFIKYNSLPPGKYIFQIAYLHDINVRNIKEIHFEIKSPFWQKWWFYLILLGLVVCFVRVYFNYKLKKVKKKQEEEMHRESISKMLVFSQLEALRSQMNPHFIFNALNSIQEYIVFNNKELASSYLVKFSRLIRIYLEHSQQNEVVLKEEINALKIYLELEKIRFEDILNYELQADENLSLEQIKIPSLFIQPYVENAIKHGLLHKLKDRELKVFFKKDELNNCLICTIEDNGIGRKASVEINKKNKEKHQSFATSANEKRLELINLNRNQKIIVEIVDMYLGNNEATGTRVLIKIPLNF